MPRRDQVARRRDQPQGAHRPQGLHWGVWWQPERADPRTLVADFPRQGADGDAERADEQVHGDGARRGPGCRRALHLQRPSPRLLSPQHRVCDRARRQHGCRLQGDAGDEGSADEAVDAAECGLLPDGWDLHAPARHVRHLLLPSVWHGQGPHAPLVPARGFERADGPRGLRGHRAAVLRAAVDVRVGVADGFGGLQPRPLQVRHGEGSRLLPRRVRHEAQRTHDAAHRRAWLRVACLFRQDGDADAERDAVPEVLDQRGLIRAWQHRDRPRAPRTTRPTPTGRGARWKWPAQQRRCRLRRHRRERRRRRERVGAGVVRRP
mmetsp:Transcript_4484/g.11826  ORF Transcript_4484/g.11826 Transcript_4484/m.11826 type:complete len:321 (+) Transcript_4484:603-1565(+)